jgi:hypothetical protein
LTYEDKVEIAAWCRINGPLPLLRPDYHNAQLAVLQFNSNLGPKSAHNAKRLEDFLLWGDKPDATETELRQAMNEMGVSLRRGNPSDE